jgi:hypothetical protein
MDSVIPLQQAVYREFAHFVGWESREAGKGPATGPEREKPEKKQLERVLSAAVRPRAGPEVSKGIQGRPETRFMGQWKLAAVVGFQK